MKKTIALCAALLVGGAAFAAEGESSYAVTLDFPYVSKYVFRGVELADHSIQPSVEVSVGDFYAGVWNNTPLQNEHDGDISKETDIYIGYAPALTESLTADFGATYFWYPAVGPALDDYSFEISAGVTWSVKGFTPSLYLYRDLHLDVTTIQTGVGYSIPLASLGTSLDLNATFGAVQPDDGEDYCYYSVGVSVPYKLSDKFTLNVGASYVENDLDNGDDPGFWGTIGVTYSFE